MKIISKKVRINIYIYLIVLFLIFISFLTIINLVGTIQLRHQTNIILKQFSSYESAENKFSIIQSPDGTSLIVDADGKVIKAILEGDKVLIAGEDMQELVQNKNDNSNELGQGELDNNKPWLEETANNLPVTNVYSNISTDSFSNSYFFDTNKTNLYFDDKTTALMFEPLYDFSYERPCSEPFCGLYKEDASACLGRLCLATSEGKIYYQGKEQSLPGGLTDKNIIKINISPLETKWLVAFLVQTSSQEEIYLYFFEGGRFILLSNPSNLPKLRTSHNRGNGHLSAAGDDKQFLFLYSGYEGIAFLYNQGSWQNVSTNLGFRVMSGGFPAKIVRDGTGKQATWYICSLDAAKPKLIKLWQNNTEQIQGSIDLSYILKDAAACAYHASSSLKIASSNGLYIFKDNGFNNSQTYYYQSVNLSSFKNKQTTLAYLYSTILNADKELFDWYLSANGLSWQKLDKAENLHFNHLGDGLYLRAEFRPADSNYSPWLDSVGTLSYRAKD